MLTRPLICVLIALPLTVGSLASLTQTFCATAMSEKGVIAQVDQQDILQLQERGSGRRENPNRI